MTEFYEGFESALPGNWEVSDISTEGNSVTDRWEQKHIPDIASDQKSKERYYELRKKADFVNHDSLFWTLGEDFKEFDLTFYMSIYYKGATTEPTQRVEVYTSGDTADNSQGTKEINGASLPEHYIGVSVKYDYAGGNASHTVKVWEHDYVGATTAIISIVPSAADMPKTETEIQHFGFRLIVTTTRIQLWTDYANVGIWTKQGDIARGPYVYNFQDTLIINQEDDDGARDNNELPLVDDIRLATGDHIMDLEQTVVGMVLPSASELFACEANARIGTSSVAKIVISNPQLSDFTTLLDNIGKVIYVIDSTDSKIMFRGEIWGYKLTANGDRIVFIASSLGRSLTDVLCNTNNLIGKGTLRYLHTNNNDDKDAAYINLETWIGHAIICEKATANITVIYPHVLTDGALVPASGSLNSLYHEDEELVYGPHFPNNGVVQFDYYVYLKSGVDIKDITVEFVMQLEKSGDPVWHTSTILKIYNGDTSLYEIIETLDHEEGGGYQDFNIAISLATLGTITDYLGTVAGANDSGFIQYRLRLRYEEGEHDVNQLILKFHTMKCTITLNDAIGPGIGQGKIHADSDAVGLVMDETPEWALDDFPLADGFGDEDIFYISKFMDDTVVDVARNSLTKLLFDWNVTGLSSMPDPNDRTNEYISDWLTTLTNRLKSIWFEAFALNTIKVRSMDNVSSTGIALTEADHPRGRSAFTLDYDGRQIVDTVKIFGKYDTQEDSTTKEYTMRLGERQKVYQENEVINAMSLQAIATNKVIQHSYGKMEFRWLLNLTDPNQSYADIEMGDTVELSIDNKAGNEILSFTGANELLILGYTFMRLDDGNEFLHLVLQRRKAS